MNVLWLCSGCAEQESGATSVLRDAASSLGCKLTECTEPDMTLELPFWLSPLHQQLNAGLAVAMIRSLEAHGHLPPDASWVSAVHTARLPARFEIFRPGALNGSQLIVDVAHNEPAVAALVLAVSRAFPVGPLAVIFGANHDKDLPALIRQVSQLRLQRVVAVSSGHPKACSPSEIVAAASTMSETRHAQWDAAESMSEALSVSARAVGSDGVVLCCGSVFVAAALREELAAKQPDCFPQDDWVFEQAGEPPLLM